jgi:hypothetical protein
VLTSVRLTKTKYRIIQSCSFLRIIVYFFVLPLVLWLTNHLKLIWTTSCRHFTFKRLKIRKRILCTFVCRYLQFFSVFRFLKTTSQKMKASKIFQTKSINLDTYVSRKEKTSLRRAEKFRVISRASVTPNYSARRSGHASASGTRRPGFESRQGVRFLGKHSRAVEHKMT